MRTMINPIRPIDRADIETATKSVLEELNIAATIVEITPRVAPLRRWDVWLIRQGESVRFNVDVGPGEGLPEVRKQLIREMRRGFAGT